MVIVSETAPSVETSLGWTVKVAVSFALRITFPLVKPVPSVMVNFPLVGKETSTVPVPVLDTVTVCAAGRASPAVKLPKDSISGAALMV